MTNEDAINREDALKLIYDFKEKHTEDREKHPINYGTLLDLIRLIRGLPSVTQKHNYCASCKHNTDTYNEICLECEYERYEPVTQKPIECDDAISRQAVLSEKIYTETEEGWSGYTVDADYIEHLPSVTPKCEKCAMNGSDSKYCNNCGQKSGKWIPVSERLPDIGQRVLVTYNQEDKLKVDTTIFDRHGFLIGVVTAWMPLPKPYEPQESEDKE